MPETFLVESELFDPLVIPLLFSNICRQPLYYNILYPILIPLAYSYLFFCVLVSVVWSFIDLLFEQIVDAIIESL